MVSQVMGASSQINIRRRMPQVSRRVRDLLLLVILSEERSDESKDLLLLPICHHERSEGSALARHPERREASAERSRRTCFYFRFVITSEARDLLSLPPSSPVRSPLRAESKDPLLLPICHHERSEGSAFSSSVILSGARFGRSRRTCFYFRFVITSEARDLLFLPPSS